MQKKVLGVITARGGSKGIAGKNIKRLLGKPLIAYTIEAAQESGVLDQIVLTTDDEAIAKVARTYGCEVPFMRPAELALDATPHLPVMQHAVTWLKEHENYAPDYVMILQPTSPLRQPWHIKEAFELLLKKEADSVVSFSEIPGHDNPMWAVKVDDEGIAKLFVSGEPLYKRIPRRQDLPKSYTNNGAIYIFKTSLLFIDTPNFYGEKTAAYVMEEKYTANIDTLDDWAKAEQALAKLKKGT